MNNKYKKYSKRLLTAKEAGVVLKFIFGGATPNNITEDQRRFAQFLLVDMLDKSIAMGFAESLFRSSMKPGANVTGICRKLLKDSSKLAPGWFKLSSKDDLMEAAGDIKIYQSVHSQLKRNFRSQWEMMKAGI